MHWDSLFFNYGYSERVCGTAVPTPFVSSRKLMLDTVHCSWSRDIFRKQLYTIRPSWRNSAFEIKLSFTSANVVGDWLPTRLLHGLPRDNAPGKQVTEQQEGATLVQVKAADAVIEESLSEKERKPDVRQVSLDDVPIGRR